MATKLGKNVVFWDALLYRLIGFAVSVLVLSVGPLMFGKMPPWLVVLAGAPAGRLFLH